MSSAANLFKVQRIDTELDAHRRRLAEIDALLASDADVTRARAQLESTESALGAARRAHGLIRDEIDQVAAKRKNSETRLYSGAIKNPKELQDLQHEVEALGRRIEQLEEHELEALIELEDTEQAEATARANFEAATARWNAAQADLLEEKARREKETARLGDEREAAIIPVRATDREVYERLRAAKGGTAVTRVEEGTCSACGVAPSASRIQQARNSGELIRCGNCGRILYVD